MKNIKKILSVLLITILLVGCEIIGIVPPNGSSVTPTSETPTSETPTSESPSSTTQDRKYSNRISILELNDVHGYIEQTIENDDFSKPGKGGISNDAYLIEELRKVNDVVLIANGDMLQGTAISNQRRGLSVIDAMNEMDFDAMGVGNHEFDWGIDKINAYFDGDEGNGEANFPLLNSNITPKKGQINELDGQNVKSVVYVDKKLLLEGKEVTKKVAIISAIDTVCYGSILYSRVRNYNFEDVVDSVTPIAKEAKNNGADIIIVNVHGGEASGVNYYDINNELAMIKDNQGNYLVDAIINGHTHTRQKGNISRSKGLSVPVIQSSGNNQTMGKIDLNFNNRGELASTATSHYYIESDAGFNCVESIENRIREETQILKSIVYATAGETITDKSQLQTWVGNVMLAWTSGDFAICNTGGLRSAGNIVKGKPVGVINLYEINPFDNYIVRMKISGRDLYSYCAYKGTSIFCIHNDEDLSIESLRYSDDLYTLVIIDYLYQKSEMMELRNKHDTDFYSEQVLRDIMINDTIARGGEDGSGLFLPYSEPESVWK